MVEHRDAISFAVDGAGVVDPPGPLSPRRAVDEPLGIDEPAAGPLRAVGILRLECRADTEREAPLLRVSEGHWPRVGNELERDLDRPRSLIGGEDHRPMLGEHRLPVGIDPSARRHEDRRLTALAAVDRDMLHVRNRPVGAGAMGPRRPEVVAVDAAVREPERFVVGMILWLPRHPLLDRPRSRQGNAPRGAKRIEDRLVVPGEAVGRELLPLDRHRHPVVVPAKHHLGRGHGLGRSQPRRQQHRRGENHSAKVHPRPALPGSEPVAWRTRTRS